LADAHSFSPRTPSDEELRASPGIRPTIAGRPASAVQIAEELTRRRAPHPEPVSALMPGQARNFNPATTGPSQVPPSWTGSGADTRPPGDPLAAAEDGVMTARKREPGEP